MASVHSEILFYLFVWNSDTRISHKRFCSLSTHWLLILQNLKSKTPLSTVPLKKQQLAHFCGNIIRENGLRSKLINISEEKFATSLFALIYQVARLNSPMPNQI